LARSFEIKLELVEMKEVEKQSLKINYLVSQNTLLKDQNTALMKEVEVLKRLVQDLEFQIIVKN
jgi:hypothetical protein